MVEMFYFLLFYKVLDLNKQTILCLPSIFQFQVTLTNLNPPSKASYKDSYEASFESVKEGFYTLFFRPRTRPRTKKQGTKSVL